MNTNNINTCDSIKPYGASLYDTHCALSNIIYLLCNYELVSEATYY
jgi:hypothetical protein